MKSILKRSIANPKLVGLYETWTYFFSFLKEIQGIRVKSLFCPPTSQENEEDGSRMLWVLSRTRD